MDKQSEPKPETEGLSPAEEARLIQEAQKGNVASYDVLIRYHYTKLYGLVYNMTSNNEDAEDLLQEIFLKAYQSLPRFKGNSSFYTWLYRIAINRSINFIKRRKKRQTLSLDQVDGAVERDPDYVDLSSRESPFRDMTLTELQEKLNKALLTLSEKHRTVVILHDIQGIPHQEIADMLKCSQGTVRSRLFYARKQLQVELSEFTP